jgi:NAD(P)-dependent dehydrogenase (short-subunit alcohol dehydrogenase family)
VGSSGRLENTTVAAWDEQLAQDLRTAFVVTKAAVPHLKVRGGGAIVGVTSVSYSLKRDRALKKGSWLPGESRLP